MKPLTILVLILAGCGTAARPDCFSLCPGGGETTGLLSNQCPDPGAVPRVDTGCVCLTRGGIAVPVTGCEVKAKPGKGTYDYVCEDGCE